MDFLSSNLLGEAEMLAQLYKVGPTVLLVLTAQALKDPLTEKDKNLQSLNNAGVLSVCKNYNIRKKFILHQKSGINNPHIKKYILFS